MSASIISSAKLQDDMSSIPLADDDPQGKLLFSHLVLVNTHVTINHRDLLSNSRPNYCPYLDTHSIVKFLLSFVLLVIIPEEDIPDNDSHLSDPFARGRSMDSIPSTFTNGSCSPNSEFFQSTLLPASFFPNLSCT